MDTSPKSDQARQSALNELRAAVGSWVREWGNTDKVLYHYTDPKGFDGIMNSNTAWATNAIALNDAVELEFGLKAVHQAISSRRRSLESSQANRLLESIEHQFLELRKNTATVFIVSFTEAQNKLVQWRYYGNREGGFALGFDAKKLANLSIRALVDQGSTMLVSGPYPVTYGEANIEQKAHSLLEMACTAYNNLIPTWCYDEASLMAAWAERLTGYLWALGTTGKHMDFSDEEEWRLVTIPVLYASNGVRRPKVIKLAARETVLTAYMEVKGILNALVDVWVGPGRFQSINYGSAYIALMNADLNDVTVHKSMSPFQVVR